MCHSCVRFDAYIAAGPAARLPSRPQAAIEAVASVPGGIRLHGSMQSPQPAQPPAGPPAMTEPQATMHTHGGQTTRGTTPTPLMWALCQVTQLPAMTQCWCVGSVVICCTYNGQVSYTAAGYWPGPPTPLNHDVSTTGETTFISCTILHQ